MEHTRLELMVTMRALQMHGTHQARVDGGHEGMARVDGDHEDIADTWNTPG